jgi:plasmid stability protein
MGVLVQIRDVPEDVHRKLKARAALQGVSLSEYLRGLLEASASRLTPEELVARVASREPVQLSERPEVIIRELRGELPG